MSPSEKSTPLLPKDLNSCQNEHETATWVASRPSILKLAQLIYKTSEQLSDQNEDSIYHEEDILLPRRRINRSQNVSNQI